MTRFAWLIPLALLAGCAAPPEPSPMADATAPDGIFREDFELYDETFDFGRIPPDELRDPFDVPAGLSDLTLRVRWIALAPIAPGGAEIKLETPDGENALECEIAAGPTPSAPCETALPNPVGGTWDVEYEGGGPGLRAEVVVLGGAAS